MSRAGSLGPFLFAAVLALVLFEVFFLAPDLLRAHLLEAIVLTLTLQVGHIAFSYVMIVRDPELRARFPWIGFLALNCLLFAGFWMMGKKFRIENHFVILLFYNALRIFHDTQQGYGVARLVSADHGAAGEETELGMKSFTRAVRWLAIGGMLVAFLVPHREWRIVAALAVAGLTAFLFHRFVFRRRAEVDPAFLVLGRFNLLGLGTVSHIAPVILRTIHGLEYTYVYFRYFRSKVTALLVAGLVAAILVQGGFLLAKVFASGAIRVPGLRVFAVLIHTLVITHIVQDWYVFAYDKVSARRMRQLLS